VQFSARKGVFTRERAMERTQFVNEDVDDADRIVFSHVVVKEFGKQTPCVRSSPSTKRFIKNPDSIHQDSNPANVFTQPGPEGDLQDRPDERARSAGKRSSAEGMSCAGLVILLETHFLGVAWTRVALRYPP
jgi:hypothetical protein